MTDEELEIEFEVLLKKAALDVEPDRRHELFREFKAFRAATTLLRQDLAPYAEPANVFRTPEFLDERRGE